MTEPLAKACYCGVCPTCAADRSPVADPLLFRHSAIKHRLLARIAATEIDRRRPLEKLGTRDDDDPAIALIDAFAGSLHILAWNAARLFDDGTIRRTEDRDALVDLAGLLGYEPRPALAATTTLAFTLDDLEGSPKIAEIPKGAKVASVPGQDEKPQTFETDAELEARAEWNALKPVQVKTTPRVDATTTTIVVAGAATTAKIGDLVLVYLDPQTSSQNWLLARIASVTRVPNPEPGEVPPKPPHALIGLASSVALRSIAAQQGGAFKNAVVILGQRAAAFGATAPDLRLMSEEIRKTQLPPKPAIPFFPNIPPIFIGGGLPTEWRDLHMPAGTVNGGAVDLDAVYADAMKDRFVLFTTAPTSQTTTEIGRIDSVTERSRRDFGLSAKISRIDVTGVDLASARFREHVRETVIYIETARERLLVEDADIETPAAAAADRIIVRGAVSLPVGRRVVLSGEPWTATRGKDPKIAEVATLSSATPVGGDTELVFARPIAGRYHSTTLTLFANCVGASQGETPFTGAQLIGSGAAASLSPRFVLEGSPLTYVPADNARGYAPAIEVRVGDRLFAEKPTIFGLGSEDRAYKVRTARGGKSEIQFAGRLPSGTLNVSALYRTGGGRAGNLPAGRITTAMAPIVGVRSVTNPVPAQGASDAETIDDMRAAAPQSIRTLDRVVSLADFEAFARNYRGVGKALATELHVGMRSVVCLTIATTDLEPPTPGSDLVDLLRNALALAAPPGRSIRIEGFTELTARVTVALAVDPAFRRADVEAKVRAALGAAFGRATRRFGEALHRSAVVAAVQKVEGVIAATLTSFTLPGGPPESEGRLLCPAPAIAGGAFTRAGLLSIDPAQVTFAEMQP